MRTGVPSRPKVEPDLVLQIPLIGKVEQLGRRLQKQTKCGRPDARLGHVVDLQAAALVRGGLHPGGGIGQHRS